MACSQSEARRSAKKGSNLDGREGEGVLDVVGRRVWSREKLVKKLVVVAFDDKRAENGNAVEMGCLNPVSRVE